MNGDGSRGRVLDHGQLRRQTPFFCAAVSGVSNQDWDLDHPDIEAAYVEAFDADGLEARRAMIAELRTILEVCRTDAEASDFLEHAGCVLNTEGAAGLAPRARLQMVHDRLVQGL